jgi:hypothetical protein
MEIIVVPDQPCPGCGAYWGHPDPALDFPNRVKVDDHWKCYNPNCDVAYYRDGTVTELVMSALETREMVDRIKKQFANVKFTVVDQ